MKILTLIFYALLLHFSLSAQSYIEQFDVNNKVIELCGFGTYNFPNMQSNENMPSVNSCLPEENFTGSVTWIKFDIDQPGALEFELSPKYLNHDIDFELYNVRFSEQQVPGSLVRCNANGANLGAKAANNEICLGATGMKSQEELIFQYPGCTEVLSNFVLPAYTRRGEIYYLKIINQSGSAGFTLHLGGTSTVQQESDLAVKYTYSSEQLCFEFEPVGAKNAIGISWDFGLGASIIAQESNGKSLVKYDVPGMKKVILTENTDGCFAQTQVDLEVLEKEIQKDVQSVFNAFPNPVSEELTLAFQLQAATSVTLLIHGSEGRVLFEENQDFPAGSHQLPIDFSELNAGIYIVELRTVEQSLFQKIIKANSIK